jgi:hypothetical protein
MSSYMFETRDPLPHEMYGCVCVRVGEKAAPRTGLTPRARERVFLGAGLGLTAVIAAIAAIAIGTTAAVAQKIQDRHPAMVVDTFEQRWDALPRPLTFEERWAPVRQLMVRQSFRTAQAATPVAEKPSAGSVEPLRERPVRTVPMRALLAVPAAAGPVQQTCVRHRMRTVWYGQRWRCRR